MFIYQNLHSSPLLENKKAPNPKYFRRIFEYIKEEICSLPEFPCSPDDQVMWSMYTEMISSFVQSINMIKDIDLEHIMESPTLRHTNHMMQEYENESPRHNMLDHRAEERLETEGDNLLKEVYSWVIALFQENTDDYYFQNVQGNIKLMCSFSGGIYEPEQDLDYQDYFNLRTGYTHIKRILLKMRAWPTAVTEKSTNN